MKWTTLLLAGTVAGLMTANLGASTLGSFSLAGNIIVNGTSTIDWTDPSNVAMKAVLSDTTGIYAGLDGQEVTIQDLSSSTEPAGYAGFPDMLFITFPNGAAPLYLNVIYPGVDSSAQCGTLPPAPGQTCTPALPGGALSPFNFQNNPPPSSPQATATFAFGGDVNHLSNETWIGNFTSQFNVPFQTVLSQLSTTGTVENTYSASFTVSSTATPETSTLSLCGLGLGLVLLARSKSLIARMHRG